MANVLTYKIRIRVNTGQDEPAILIVRRPSADAVQRFLKARTVTRRNKLENHAYEARIDFIDGILVDVEGVAYEDLQGEVHPLNSSVSLENVHPDVRGSASSWKDLIPVNWKSSAAMYFEDSDDAEEERGNS